MTETEEQEKQAFMLVIRYFIKMHWTGHDFISLVNVIEWETANEFHILGCIKVLCWPSVPLTASTDLLKVKDQSEEDVVDGTGSVLIWANTSLAINGKRRVISFCLIARYTVRSQPKSLVIKETVKEKPREWTPQIQLLLLWLVIHLLRNSCKEHELKQ